MATRRRLKTSADCRRYLANLINRLEAGEIEEPKAGKLGYLTSLLIRAIEGGVLEKRLDELEEKRRAEKSGASDLITKSESRYQGPMVEPYCPRLHRVVRASVDLSEAMTPTGYMQHKSQFETFSLSDLLRPWRRQKVNKTRMRFIEPL